MNPRPNANDTTQAVPVPLSSSEYPFLSPPARADEIGRLGAFRVLAELGRGGMGVVFRAEEIDLKRHVALKVMLPSAATDKRAAARFRREAEAQAKVEHDHIVAIYRVGECNDVPFLAMPLLKGQALGASLKTNPRPPLAELLRIGREIAEGLAAAHAVGLVHRDIKPGNIWLEGNKRRVKILDFGLARGIGSEDEPVARVSVPAAVGTQLTVAGAIMGTPAYMSPEQALSRPIDRRSDLWSLGVVLYQMATGQLPFTGASAFDVMAAVVTHEPPSATDLIPAVPLQLSDLIGQLMAKDPTARPVSAEIVADRIGALTGVSFSPSFGTPPTSDDGSEPFAFIGSDAQDTEETGHTNPDRPDRRSVQEYRRRRLWPVVVAATALAAAVTGAILVGSHPGRSLPPPIVEQRTPSIGSPAPPVDTLVRVLPQAPPPVRIADSPDEAARALNVYAELTVVDDRKRTVVVPRAGPLPAGPFRVTWVKFVGPIKPDPTFVLRVIVPNLAALPDVQAVVDWSREVRPTEQEFIRLLSLRAAARWTDINVSAPLTLRTIEALGERPLITFVGFDAAAAGDEELIQLADRAPQLTGLSLLQLGDRGRVTATGIDALARLRLIWLALNYAPNVPATWLRALARHPTLDLLGMQSARIRDEAVAELRASKLLRRLDLNRADIDRSAIPHLAAIMNLQELDVRSTPLTAEDVKELRRVAPRCRVQWDAPMVSP